MTYQKVSNDNPLFDHFHFSEEGFSCKVFPHLGGSVQELTVHGIPIIKSISLDDAGLEKYKTTYPSAVLFPFPNRVAQGKYSFNGEQFQLSINEPGYNNAIHGLISNKSFTVDQIDNQSISLRYTHHSSHGFPFPYQFIIVYSFSDTGLKLSFNVTNIGTQSFPFGMGWHPYFELANYDQCSVDFSAEKKYVNDEKMVPIDAEAHTEEEIQLAEAELDSAYKLRLGRIVLQGPRYQLQMSVPEDCYLQLYTPKSRTALAIEPMTCIADAFNNKVGLKQLPPGSSHLFETSISIKSHD
ncbi:MAG: hypothetical protein AAF489_03780 [Bacteroidota bacterium]